MSQKASSSLYIKKTAKVYNMANSSLRHMISPFSKSVYASGIRTLRMPGISLECPHCGQRIINAVANAENRIRCGACENNIELNASGTVLVFEQPGGASAIPAAQSPTGKEPAPASYGLLSATAFAVLILGLTMTACFTVFAAQNAQGPAAYSPFSWQGGVACALAGLAFLCCVNSITRLDQRAAWIAWRSGALSESPGEPPGSGLPYILPFAVIGGITLMAGLARSNWETTFAPVETLLIVLIGVVLFLTGLSCGELRRFFWRMAQFGNALPGRTRGEELTLGQSIRKAPGAPTRRTERYLYAALAAIMIIFASNIVYSRVSGSTGELMAAVAIIGIAGAAWTPILLSKGWCVMTLAWAKAAASIRDAKTSTRGRFITRGLAMAVWLISFLLALTLIGGIGLSAINGELGRILGNSGVGARNFRLGISFWVYSIINAICIVSMLIFLALWMNGLAQDAFQFVQSTSTMAFKRKKDAHRRALSLLAALIAGFVIVKSGLETYQQFSTMSGFLSMRGRGISSVFITFTLLTMLGNIVTQFVPGLLIAVVMLHLRSAANNLDGCVEAPPLPPKGSEQVMKSD